MQKISKNEAVGPFLDDAAALKIAQHRTGGVVYLAALDCNWAEDAAKNYFNIWVAVSFHQNNDRVFLHGAKFCNWNLDYEMKLVNTVNNMSLYRLSLNKSGEFPDEFVIRLERESGEHIYDNNDYVNYSIEYSRGHLATAIALDSAIVSYETITPFKVYV